MPGKYRQTFAGLGLQTVPVEDFHHAPVMPDQTLLLKSHGGQGYRLTAHSQYVGDLCLGQL